MERFVTSRDLQLHYEVEAMAGSGVNRRAPGFSAYLLRHLRESKRSRLAKSEDARLKREAHSPGDRDR